MKPRSASRAPGIWRGLWWALNDSARATLGERLELAARTVWATFAYGPHLRRWMAVVREQVALGLAPDVATEYLRALRPYVHGRIGVPERIVQLIDHVDWLDMAFEPAALEVLAAGDPLVLTQLPAPAGFIYMQLQLQRAPAHSPEGELLLTLTVLREPATTDGPLVAAALGFSRFRIAGKPCLVIGGVRGLRETSPRMSPTELDHALNGWKPGVLMVRVAQELARVWELRLIGLDPRAHRLNGWRFRWRGRHRSAAERIRGSYRALWRHFAGRPGPAGWVVLPAHLDEKLAATAASPERRARQARRADFWIRLRNVMRLQLRTLIKPPPAGDSLQYSTSRSGPITSPTIALTTGFETRFRDTSPALSARVARTGPADLI